MSKEYYVWKVKDFKKYLEHKREEEPVLILNDEYADFFEHDTLMFPKLTDFFRTRSDNNRIKEKRNNRRKN